MKMIKNIIISLTSLFLISCSSESIEAQVIHNVNESNIDESQVKLNKKHNIQK
jgi:hypothetical protein